MEKKGIDVEKMDGEETRKGEIRLSYGCPKTGVHQLISHDFDPNYLHNVCFF